MGKRSFIPKQQNLEVLIRAKTGQEFKPMARNAIKSYPSYVVIIRAIHERGNEQRLAVQELARRGLYLTAEQRQQAQLTDSYIPMGD